MKKVSIIVPVYNVEKYLSDCLDSILSQNFKDMEVICVDDASDDNSARIIKEYEKKDEKIKAIFHKKNSGLSATRNSGLKYAQGEYLWFVDSDDVISQGAVERLYRCATEKDVDVVYFEYKKFSSKQVKGVVNLDSDSDQHLDVYSGREFFCMEMEDNKAQVTAWCIFLRREFLEKEKITFKEGIYHEDNLFSFLVAMEAKRVYRVPDVLYYYRQREGSITQTKNVLREQSMFVVMTEVFSYWKSHFFSDRESKCIGEYLKLLYREYRFYQSYHEKTDELLVGDAADKALYSILCGDVEKEWLKVEKIPLEEVKEYQQVIVYGAGRASRQVIRFLEKKHIEIAAVLVESASDNVDKFCGIKVHELNNFRVYPGQNIVIIGVTSKKAMGIEKTLEKKGFERIIRVPDK